VTIVVAVKVRDGVALVTDSMTTVQRTSADRAGKPQSRWVKGYPNTQKLFQLRGLPIGVVIWGVNVIGRRSVRGLIGEFNRQSGESAQVGEVAASLCSFIRAAYDEWYGEVEAAKRLEFGAIVSGYGPDEPFGEVYSFVFPLQEEPRRIRDQATLGASWAGYQLPVDRIFYSLDPRLRATLIQAGLESNAVDQAIGALRRRSMQVAFDSMPLQDALDFATYLVDTTIGYAHFDAGAPVCGGPIQAAVIDREGGFQWTARPRLVLSARPRGRWGISRFGERGR
jgi:hypothetical protein